MGDFFILVAQRGYGGIFPENFPVFLFVGNLPLPDVSGFDRTPQVFVKFSALNAGIQQARILTGGFVKTVAGNLGKLRVHVLDGPLRIGDDHRYLALFDGGRQLLKVFFGFLALGNIAEHHHAPRDGAVLGNRHTAVFYVKMGAVFAPQDFIVDLGDRAPGQGVMHRTFLDRIGGSVGMRMVNQAMNLFAEHFFSRKSQHGQSSRIDKIDQSVFPGSKDAFAG